MAEAIVRGVIERGVAKAPDILVSEPLESRRTALVKTYGVGCGRKTIFRPWKTVRRWSWR